MTAEAPPVEQRAPLSTQQFVHRTITGIQRGFLAEHQSSESRAALARLRRGAGRDASALPDLYPLLINPDAPPNASEVATRDETAIHTALTLYAMHQQSQPRAMHVTGTTFGAALGRLYRSLDDNPGVLRRFQALGTASQLSELVHHARGLVTMLRSEGIAFDYGWFAADLVGYQDPRRADGIRLRWGRDFYRVPTHDVTTPTASEEQS
jgi:CRISPR system Cascade subunit CasB